MCAKRKFMIGGPEEQGRIKERKTREEGKETGRGEKGKR